MRVLLVEDNPDDADLLLRELRRGGLEIVHERVETEAAMNGALDAHAWDLVIADYSLPSFSGLAALALVQRRGLDAPFILVSGNLGEETAVAAMKAGASDYLMKGNLARLVPAVQREMRDAQLRREALRIERNLHERDAQLAEAQRLAHVGSWHWDARADLTIWSDEMYRICGRDPQHSAPDMDGFLACVHPDDRSLAAAPLRSADRQFAHDLRIVRGDGSIRFVHVRGDVRRDERGEPVEIVGTLQDITERKLAEQELRSAHDALEARVRERTTELSEANASLRGQQLKLEAARHAAESANQSKSDFLANMSHEIRTPMTAILGYADMLLDPELSPSDRLGHVHTIRRNAEHLLTVLNDILDLSKIEAGKLQVERIDTDVRQVVNDVLSLMRVRAVEKGLALDVTYAGAIPQMIQTDPTRLRQVLTNLISNAIKFTERGGVNVVVTLAGLQAEQSQLEFAVIDSGIGMNARQMEQLFKPFEQADTSTTRKYGGTGLGLTICRRLARMLGGDIEVQSRPGAGSRFVLRIETGNLAGVPLLTEPRESIKPRERNAQPEQSVTLRGRILLAEDGIHNQRVISYYLQRAGAEVVVADNGRIACQKIADAQEQGRMIDAVLMDMQMPELDGYTAAATLRSRGYKGPIIALTAHAMSQDRERCLKSGCSDYLSKPVDRNLLICTVAAHLENAVTSDKSAAQARNPASPALEESPPMQESPAVQTPVESLPSEMLRSTLANDPEMCSFLPSFVADLPALVSWLASHLNEHDLKELRGTIHQLKGTGGFYGFMPLTDAAEQIENTIDAPQSIENVADQVHRLIDLIRRVEGYQRANEASAS